MDRKLELTNIVVMRFGAAIQIIVREDNTLKKLISVLLALCLALALCAFASAEASIFAGGLVGTGLYYYGEETAFRITNCSVSGEIIGAVTPGAVAGRAGNSVIESCEANVTLEGAVLTDEVGETTTM